MNTKTRLATSACMLLAMWSGSGLASLKQAPHPTNVESVAGVHSFDFLRGTWRIHHRRLKTRLKGAHDWEEFQGTCISRSLMDGRANVDDYVLSLPGDPYRAAAIRSYDQATDQWAIWWLDGRKPLGNLDPAVKGRFVNGIGTFYSDDTLDGKPIRVRYVWSRVTPRSARWEQAFSADGGKSWEVNWVMDFKRS